MFFFFPSLSSALHQPVPLERPEGDGVLHPRHDAHQALAGARHPRDQPARRRAVPPQRTVAVADDGAQRLPRPPEGHRLVWRQQLLRLQAETRRERRAVRPADPHPHAAHQGGLHVVRSAHHHPRVWQGLLQRAAGRRHRRGQGRRQHRAARRQGLHARREAQRGPQDQGRQHGHQEGLQQQRHPHRGDKPVPAEQRARGAGGHDAAATPQDRRGVHGAGQQPAGQSARPVPRARLAAFSWQHNAPRGREDAPFCDRQKKTLCSSVEKKRLPCAPAYALNVLR